MISVIKRTQPVSGRYCLEMIGLSTDEINTDEFDDLGNGSLFYEIDTGKMYIYDEASGDWVASDDQSTR